MIWPIFALSNSYLEFRGRHDQPVLDLQRKFLEKRMYHHTPVNKPSQLAWKAYLIFMCTNFTFVPLVYFFYPETANRTLEEVDYLFIREGNKGAKQLWHRSQPVIISLKEDVESNAAAMGLGEHMEEKDGVKADTLRREESADHIEAR